MIIPMKKARLIFFKADKDQMLMALQKIGEFMIISSDDNSNDVLSDKDQSDLMASEAVYEFLHKHEKKRSLLSPRPEASLKDFEAENSAGTALQEKASKLEEKINRLDKEHNNLYSQNLQLKPWLRMDIPLDQLSDTKHVRVWTGIIPENATQELENLGNNFYADIILFDSSEEGRASLVLSSENGNEFDTALNNLGFKRIELPQYNGTSQELYKLNCSRMEKLNEKLAKYNEEADQLAKNIDQLSLLNEQRYAANVRDNVRGEETAETICLWGWVPEDRVKRVKKTVESVTDASDIEFFDPQPDDDPPTVTRNSYFWSQFETITEMFSLPKAGSIDPAPVAGPWYWVIFGMMMGDVGYGVCMLVLFYLFRKIKKPRGSSLKLINILLYSSVTTIVFGVLFGSYFGETWHPIIFAPLNNPIQFLIFTLIVGVLHIFSGMGIKIAEQIKAGHALDAFFDQVSWMILITGLGFLFIPALSTAGKWMAIVGAVIILCTAGRDKPNVVGKITGGLLGLYDISSYLSDILSYSRILALSLATGVIGMVMNLLARMVMGSPINPIGFILALVIYLIGHTFNLAMSLLSAYVHDSRLQYIEFFGKFYEGGGKPFKPLSIESKYLNVSEIIEKKQ